MQFAQVRLVLYNYAVPGWEVFVLFCFFLLSCAFFTDTQHTNDVSKYIKTLTPDKSRELGADLGLAYDNLLRMSAGTLHLDMAHAWLVGHDQSRDVSGDPTWRALALACAKQDMWGLVWRIEQGTDSGHSLIRTPRLCVMRYCDIRGRSRKKNLRGGGPESKFHKVKGIHSKNVQH